MYMGPLTWSNSAKFRVPRDKTVDSAVSCPFDASRQSNVISSPDLTCSAGGMLCDVCQSWRGKCNVPFQKYVPVVPSEISALAFQRMDRHCSADAQRG